MKKYVKPEIYFESFQLSQHIAACGWDVVQLNDIDTCVTYGEDDGIYNLNTSTKPLMIDGNTNCEGRLESYCYTNGTDAIKVFQS